MKTCVKCGSKHSNTGSYCLFCLAFEINNLEMEVYDLWLGKMLVL